MTIYSLGLLQDARALPALQAALNDNHQDVRWNAALALARFQDASGVEILHRMLDRKSLNSSSEINEQQKSEAIINAARAVALLKDSSARPLLEELKANDPDVKVRSAAIEALKEIELSGSVNHRKKAGSP
jgi:HEAT repeat protein